MVSARSHVWSLILVSFAAWVSTNAPVHAEYRMCAYRSGPNGPCTCQTATDAPGQFTTVARSHCRKGQRTSGRNGTQLRQEKPIATAASQQSGEQTSTAETAPPNSTKPAAADRTQALVTGSLPSGTKTLDTVRNRGRLVCGVNPGLLGFAHRTPSGIWAGIDVDFCRAVAMATLGDPETVEFVPLDAAQRFEALTSGKIDLLSRNTTWTMSRDVDLGLEFVGVLYFDGQSFTTREARGLVSAQQLGGATVCVQSSTTTEANMGFYFKAHGINAEVKAYKSRDELVKAYLAGDCQAYSADRSSLFADRAGFPDPAEHTVLPEVISKEPLGPAVRQGDQEWLEIVRWTLAGLVNAEEVRLDKAAAGPNQALSVDGRRLADGAAKSGAALRLDKDWLTRMILAVGNYGEMFEANIGKTSPLGMDRGINALWKNGGILYAPPMW